MPTYQPLPRFLRDHRKLTKKQAEAFEQALALFIEGLLKGRFDPRLRIKRVQRTVDVWEMSWAGDGRATFQYGPEVTPGQAHIVWRRIGAHSILQSP